MSNKIMHEAASPGPVPGREGKSIGQQKRETFLKNIDADSVGREERLLAGEAEWTGPQAVRGGIKYPSNPGFSSQPEWDAYVMRSMMAEAHGAVENSWSCAVAPREDALAVNEESVTTASVLNVRDQREPNIRDVVLDKAKVTINGAREEEYGNKTENFQRIADLWSPIIGVKVTRAQVAMMMIQVKMARLITSPDHEDSWVDAIGYAAIGAEVQEGAGDGK